MEKKKLLFIVNLKKVAR